MKARELAEFLLKYPDADLDVSVDMSTEDDKTAGHRIFADVTGVQQSRGEINILTRFTSKNYGDAGQLWVQGGGSKPPRASKRVKIKGAWGPARSGVDPYACDICGPCKGCQGRHATMGHDSGQCPSCASERARRK